MKRSTLRVLSLVFVLFLAAGCAQKDFRPAEVRFDERGVPLYEGKPSAVLEENEPRFTDRQKSSLRSFEIYSPLDPLGRCGPAFANLSPETMPTEPRGSIGMIRPTGWHLAKFDTVDGGYLYNRCHLIGYLLSGENANERNLITGTREMNVSGMLPYEITVADFIRETGYHVLYRATPFFYGDELLCRGVELEAWSVEDRGEGISFHVFCFNAQPGFELDYATGKPSEIAKK